MVILAANQVWWTWKVENVQCKAKKGDKMAMKNYSKNYTHKLMMSSFTPNVIQKLSLPL